MIPLTSPKLPESRAKRKSDNHSNQRTILRFSISPAGQPHTLPSERDFKSLVSASLRQSRFSFVVSFYFSLRERFFLREREGFALFWQDNITTFFAPCQPCKIVSSRRAWSSERPGPGAFALPRCAPQGEVWWRVGWWFGWCIDGRNWVMGYCWFLKVTFEVIEGVLMCWLPWWILTCDVRCCLFAQSLLCLRSPLPFFYYNFAGSDFEGWNEKRVYLFDMKQSFYYKTAWMGFCNYTHTV